MFWLDINECSNSAIQCPINSHCLNTEGSFECQCNVGFRKESNGHSCEGLIAVSFFFPSKYGCIGHGVSSCSVHAFHLSLDIDECVSVDCGPNSICQNTVGSYDCLCILGYKWNGSQCLGMYSMGLGIASLCYSKFLNSLDVNECMEDFQCDMNSRCTNTEGSFNCTCITGYTGNGTVCTGMLFSIVLLVKIAIWSFMQT